jgi:hypothetical protein
MNNSFIYDEPVGGLIGLTDFTDRWKITTDSHKDGKYRETILNLFNYLNTDVLVKYAGPAVDEFNIPNGSIVINLKITDTELVIDAPFLTIPEKRVNALLRQVTELNFAVLFLTQIVLEGDRLHFRVSVPLELCEPYKLYDILYEICVNADYYDDFFIEKFQASRISEPIVTRYSPEELKAFYDSFTIHVKEDLDYLNYFREKRWFDIGVESGMISIMKMDYTFSPQGFLKTELEKAWSDCRTSTAVSEKLDTLILFFKNLVSMTFERFSDSIYKTEFLISPRRHAYLPEVKEQLKNSHLNAEKDLASSAHLSAVIFLLYGIFNLLYSNFVPRNIEEMLNQGLKKASGKDWKTASEELFGVVTSIMNLQ